MKKKIIGSVLIFCAILSLVLVGIRLGNRSAGSSGDQVVSGETESEEHTIEAGNSNLFAENGGTEEDSGSSEASQEKSADEDTKGEDGGAGAGGNGGSSTGNNGAGSSGSSTGNNGNSGSSTGNGGSGSAASGSGASTGNSGSTAGGGETGNNGSGSGAGTGSNGGNGTGNNGSGSGAGTGNSTDNGGSGTGNNGTGNNGNSGSSTGNSGSTAGGNSGSSTGNSGSSTGNSGNSTGNNDSGSSMGNNGAGSSGSGTGNNDSGSSTDNNGSGSSTDGSGADNNGNGDAAGGSTDPEAPASYRVAFALGNGQSASVTLPETDAYPADTAISALPIPGGVGSIFLGWYYDAELTDGVETGDTVKKDMTLYAKVAAGEAVTSLETPDSVVRSEVKPGTYTFQVADGTDISKAIRFINITGGNIDVSYSVEGNTVKAELEAGQTYQVELTDDDARFVLADEEEAQPESVRYLNLLTAKEEIKNASLNTGVKQIPFEATSGLDRGVFAGLYQIDDEGISTANTTSGTFTYSGETLQAGDTVAITSGDVDLTDIASTEGEVAYVKILSVNGTTYTYEMAEVGDVLFIPDVLPIGSGWDLDLTDGDVLTISVENLAKAMENAEADSLDVGDFLGFFAGAYDENITTGAASYGKITGYSFEGRNCVIIYEPVSGEMVEGALDVYYTQDREIELTEEEKAQIETEIKKDVAESGYAEEAALYLAAVMLESDNLSEAPDTEQIASRMRNMETSPLQSGNGITARAGGNSVQVSFDTANIRVSVRANRQLEHLNGNGFDVDVRVPFEVTISGSGGNAITIRVTAAFEEEVILRQNISTKRHRIRAFKYDYSLNASFEVGNYTGISFRADIETADEGSEALGERLDEIMEQMEAYQNGTVSNDGTMDSLAEIYQDVMEKANDSWIDILDVKLFETNGSAFLHIFCWQVKGSFVVSANLSASIGMEFDYTMQKRYIFSVRVKSKTATNETIDIIEPKYNFNFYVVGTVGIRAGLRLEMYVGLISLKLDKIGITAEVGAYARLYGYFFYHLGWTQSGGRQSSSSGAMLTEIGIYLEIKFVAQAFNSSKLTWNPTLYSHEWPLWSAGEQKNVYAFSRTDDTEYALTTVKTLALPGSTYDMKYMALKSGETGTVSRDDAEESSFIISFTDPAFSYDPETNTVTVTPEAGSVAEETEMVITWKNAALSFTSQPIQKIIRIRWSDPDGMRYISFDTMGGSCAEQLFGGSGAALAWPADPVRQGYTFAGWYTDRDCTEAYTGSMERMPEFPEGETGMTLYAKWTPAEVLYTVEHYLQELNGTYVLSDTEKKRGITGELTAAEAYNSIYAGFTAKEIVQETVAADGSTVTSVYYDRNSYTVTFDKNDGSEKLTQTYRYEASLAAPTVAREGYTFLGWYTESEDGEEIAEEEWVTEDKTWYAHWIENENTVCFDTAGGSAVDAQTVKTGNKILKPLDPTREGYTFGGWYQDAAGAKEWNFEQDTVSAKTTLYAKWTAEEYTLTFDAGKGSLTGSATKMVTFDAAYGALLKPVRQGYDFAGWYTAETDGEQITEESTVKTASGHTLYARWTPGGSTYTVSHWQQNAEDDAYTEVTGDRETKQGTTLAQTAAAEKTYTGFTAKPVTQETIAADGTTEVKLYYDRNTYAVTFTDGVAAENDIVRNYRYGAKAKTETAQRTGYTLSGWCKDAAGTQEWDFETDTVSTTTRLYAKWTADEYTVRLDARGGTINGSSEKTVAFDAAYGALPVPDRGGYAFLGWYTAETDGERITEESTVKTAAAHTLYAHWKSGSVSYSVSHWKQNLEDEGYTEVTADREKLLGNTDEQTIAQARTYAGFTAKPVTQETIAAGGTTEVKIYYDRNKYQISWDAGEGDPLTGSYTQGEVRYGTPVVQPDTPTKTATAEYSYSFAGWLPAVGETVTETVSYTAQFTPTANRYAITYQGVENAANGNADAYTYGEGLTLTAPEKTGYSFLGWYSGETPVTEITKTQTGEVSLTAKWQINQYTIHFETDGGSAVADITQDYDTALTAPADPTKTGHTFIGWSPKLPSVMPAEGLTLTAQWEVNRYEVSFETNGGSGVTAQSVAHGTTAVKPEAPEKTGHTFTKWYTDADCTAEYDFTQTVTGPVTLYAGWELASYPITYEMNDGTNAAENPASYTYGTGVASFADPEKRDGYVFLGWYSGETRITEISGTQTGAVTLTAEWIADNRTYNIWVAGVQVTAQNLKDVLSSDSENKGKVSYDPKAATLTLSGVKLTSGTKYGDSVDACLFISTPTTVRLVGENTIDMSGEKEVIMLNLYAKEALTFTGSGSLEMIAGATTNLSACLCPAYNGELVFDGCTVKLRNEQSGSCSYYGIYDWERTDCVLKNGASLQISCPNASTDTGNETVAYMNRGFYTVGVQLGNGCTLTLSGATRVGNLKITSAADAVLTVSENPDGSGATQTTLTAGKADSSLSGSTHTLKYATITVPAAAE